MTLPEGAAPIETDGVTLLLTIEVDGAVSDATVVESVRDDVDALVLEAARAMRFEPATRGGAPVRSRVRFRFSIAPPPSPSASTEEAGEGDDEALDGANEGGDEAPPEPTSPSSATNHGNPPTPTEPEPDEASMLSFRVRARVERPEAGAASRITLTGAELTTVPGTFGEPLRAVATFPGVARSPFGLGFFLVRGANFQNTGFYVDGFAVPILYHFGVGPAVLSSRLVERMRFYPGGYPVSLGRFSQGVVALETGVPDDTDRFRFEVEIDLLRASLLTSIPFDEGRGNVTLALRRSYYELLLPLVIDNLAIAYDDYQLRAQYRFDSHLTGSIFVFGSDDSLDQSGALAGSGGTSGGANSNISIAFQRAIARLDWRPEATTLVRLAGMIGRNVNTFSSVEAGSARQEAELESYTGGLRLDISTSLSREVRFNTGVDAVGSTFFLDITAPAPRGLGSYSRPDFDPTLIQVSMRAARSLPGIYGELVLDLAPVELSVGLRAELLRYGTYTSVAPDPRLVARYSFSPDVVAKAASGLFTEAPQVFQTGSIGGNPQLGPQRSWQNSVGIELNLPESIYIESNAFYTQMFDIARTSQEVVPGPDGSPRREFFRADQEGRAYGIELMIRRPVEQGFYGWLSYTLSRSERRNPNGDWFTFGFDQTHVLNLAASYTFDGWRFGARFQLTTGRPTRTPVVDSVTWDADGNDWSARFEDRGDRLPVYHQLDVRIDRDFDLGFAHGSIYLDVLNAYYGQNSEGLIYQYDYARSVPLPGIPIIGTLGFRGIVE